MCASVYHQSCFHHILLWTNVFKCLTKTKHACHSLQVETTSVFKLQKIKGSSTWYPNLMFTQWLTVVWFWPTEQHSMKRSTNEALCQSYTSKYRHTQVEGRVQQVVYGARHTQFNNKAFYSKKTTDLTLRWICKSLSKPSPGGKQCII